MDVDVLVRGDVVFVVLCRVALCCWLFGWLVGWLAGCLVCLFVCLFACLIH